MKDGCRLSENVASSVHYVFKGSPGTLVFGSVTERAISSTGSCNSVAGTSSLFTRLARNMQFGLNIAYLSHYQPHRSQHHII
jgi:hypothetical protein